ncbi:MAG TPA: hypothetical protein VFN07_12160 [Trueperaceae bacterium]|nr:hypothetical protein [Trueperaceae bacterium]
MAFNEGTRLPRETASKLGHLTVLESEWVSSLVQEFESTEAVTDDPSQTEWLQLETEATPLRNIWAVDGSYVTVASTGRPPKEVSFIKTALLTIDRTRLAAIDNTHPHPLLLRDVMTGSAVFHATVLPLKNVRTPKGTNYEAVRQIVRDSIRIDEQGAFFETLKWLAYSKWACTQTPSPQFSCPHCANEDAILPANADESACPCCGGTIFLTDMLGFHLDMGEDSAPDAVAAAYMLTMETLMLFTAVRLLWHYSDKRAVSEALFIKDGPLTLRGQYSKLVPNIRAFLQHAKLVGRPVHLLGQEKSGAFVDHLSSIANYAPPEERGGAPSVYVLSHDYVRREVHRSPEQASPYGSRTNWGEKVYVKFAPGTHLVLSVPTGAYDPSGNFPTADDLIGLDRILATLPSLLSHRFEGALFPIELANGIASMSSYPSSRILSAYLDEVSR